MPVYLWFYSLLSEAIVGFSHAALVVLGGAAVTHDQGSAAGAAVQVAARDPYELAKICLIGAAIRVFNYLDDHPLPVFVTETNVHSKTTVTSSTQEITK